MTKKSRPRAGSLAYYPRKKAKSHLARFSSFPKVEVKEGEKSKPLNFLAYKAGMTHVLGKDTHEKSLTAGHEVAVAATVLEAPPLKVFGVRAYGRAPAGSYGTVPLMDVFAASLDKAILKRIKNFKKKSKGKKKGTGKSPEKDKKAAKEKKPNRLEDMGKKKEKILEVRLLCHSQPGLTNMGKKKPDICEVALAGSVEQQLAYAKEKLGFEIAAGEALEEKHFVDIRAVTKGKGMQGPVKRFGVKIQRPKAKKRRVVGAISPWNPSTVMWQVARPGQMGYHSRTECNKKVLKLGLGKDAGQVNPKGGFKNYSVVQNDFVVLAGSVAGPAKRAVSLRYPIRGIPFERHKIDSIDYVAGTRAEASAELEEEVRAEKVVEKKEEKKEKKSVADEIAAAVKGDEKREKPKEK
jgi:large subunit ribosomal protein L3